jgi:hypothetical protein
MAGYNVCTCGKNRKKDHSRLAVIRSQRKCHYSAFNGHKWTPSNYSTVVCLMPGCNGMWRSKADYVDDLPIIEER